MTQSRFRQIISFWLIAGIVLGVSQYLRAIFTPVGILNSGLAFSLQLPAAAIYVVMPIFILAMIWLFYSRPSASWWWSLALGLIVGGGISNLVDRLCLNGGALDYWRLGNLSMYNLADVAITVGILLALWILSRSSWNQK